ncbi:MAG: phosphoheptose isomerase [Deltaproteobacteria bacterium]|nr:MAG: phosphoheptose isomerase [Deltaproteobacteria bacterium]
MFHQELNAHAACFEALSSMGKEISAVGRCLVDGLARGHKILICGNGGSAADAQHFAAEIVCRLEKTRPAQAALALTTDTSILTAMANDFSFDVIFTRQVEALGQPEDVLIGLSTSGHSDNIVAAIETAHEKGLVTVGLTGRTGGRLKDAADQAIIIPAESTQRIQEAHIFILHVWARQIEQALLEAKG